MQCPVCDVPLSISSREGVEIDFCPQCRGVWLDRGELDKVIERASAAMGGPARERGERGSERRYEGDRPRYADDDRRRYEDRDRRYDERRYDDRGHHGHDDDYYRKKKKRSFLDDIFDF
jgi:Zn-finger nucleic acid-binding protein